MITAIQYAKNWLPAFALASLLSGTIAQSAEPDCQKECQGNGVPHELDQYKFTTYSRAYEAWDKKNKAKVHWYETCVKNTGDNDLDFRWLIPGPSGWVLRGCAVSNPRPMSSSKSLSSYAGCIIYGGSGKTARANFLPHEDDKANIDLEPRDCLTKAADNGGLATVPLDQAAGELPESFEMRVDVFAPTSLKDVQQTLSRISFAILFDAIPEKGSFSTNVEYAIFPHSKISKITMSPSFTLGSPRWPRPITRVAITSRATKSSSIQRVASFSSLEQFP